MEWIHMFRYGKAWLQTKLRLIFGFVRTERDTYAAAPDDHRFILRLGGGPDADLVDFEVGTSGFRFYAHRFRDWPEEQAWKDTYGKE